MNILIVCHGNINRSAAGEIILNAMKPSEWCVRSAGLKTKDGLITTKKMREALHELGYTQTSILSTMMTNDLASWADAIMYMDTKNEERLMKNYGAHAAKFVRLPSLIDLHKIPDPNYAPNNELHKKVIGMLEKALSAFISSVQAGQGKWAL